MKNYYVYLVKDIKTSEFYIGSRGCVGDPMKDRYLGSPYIWKPNILNLRKVILKDSFETMESAISFEREKILESINDPLNRNYSIPNPKWNRDGKILAKDRNGKIVSVSKNDPLFGIDFVGITKGLVLVKDINNNVFYVNVDDERYINGELISNNKGLFCGKEHPNYGKVYIFDDQKNKQILVLSEELSVYLNSGWKLGTLQKGKTTNSSHCDTIWVNKNDINKRISKSEMEYYIKNEWKVGRIGLKKYKPRKNGK